MAEEKSLDKCCNEMLDYCKEIGQSTVWDRYEGMQPQCGFGGLGLCCRVCTMGPCRIDPFGEGPATGICGATAEIIAARNLARMIAAGASAHSDHGRDIAHTLLLTSQDKAQGYSIKGEKKLKQLAEELKVKIEGRTPKEIAHDVAEILLNEFGKPHGELLFTKRAPQKRQEIWKKLNIIPRSIDREVVDIMHRTNIGVDNDPDNILLQGMRTALADGWGGSMIGTDLSDVLFGEPRPGKSQANLGVLKHDEVNIIIHGHEPTLSDVIVAAAQDKELLELAKQNGAKGINLAGICCTANEVLIRHGIPLAGNFFQQELAIMTGAVEAMVVDVQCIMPALGALAKCYHTKFISTSPKAKFPYAQHMEFNEERAYTIAKEIIRTAVENFKNRNKELVRIPQQKSDLVAGFTAEYVFSMLGGKYRSTYRPLNDAIISGRLSGAVGIVGCNNPKTKHDFSHVTLAKKLIKKDVLVVVTGCSGIADAKAGLLRPEAAAEFAGRGLREICEAVGCPPVLHMGSCVDISRILMTLTNTVKEGGLGEDISDLPVAGVAPEWMSEKAVSIAFYVVASGVYTVLSPSFPVEGSPYLMELLKNKLNKMVGANFAFEEDPVKQAQLVIEHLNKKREALKLNPMMYGEK